MRRFSVATWLTDAFDISEDDSEIESSLRNGSAWPSHDSAVLASSLSNQGPSWVNYSYQYGYPIFFGASESGGSRLPLGCPDKWLPNPPGFTSVA